MSYCRIRRQSRGIPECSTSKTAQLTFKMRLEITQPDTMPLRTGAKSTQGARSTSEGDHRSKCTLLRYVQSPTGNFRCKQRPNAAPGTERRRYTQAGSMPVPLPSWRLLVFATHEWPQAAPNNLDFHQGAAAELDLSLQSIDFAGNRGRHDEAVDRTAQTTKRRLNEFHLNSPHATNLNARPV
jgi:hypothetical protein